MDAWLSLEEKQQMQEKTGLQVQVFGDFNEETPSSEEYLVIGFSPGSVPLRQRWRNNGLSADFLAEYLTAFFPDEEDALQMNKKVEVKSAVSYVANELLENAMKFNDETSHQPISIKLELHSDRLLFFVRNSLKPQGIAKFQSYIQELTTEDCSELYARQLESNVQDEASGSGLGLLTIINDYMAKVGWKFERVVGQPEIAIVTTMVQLDL